MGAKSINNIEYILVGDYYIPDRKLPNEERYREIWVDAPRVSEGAQFNDVQ